MNAKAELIAAEEPALSAATAVTPMQLLSQALASGQSAEVLSKFMDLQERWEKNQARKAFDEAVAAAKAAIPVILTNRVGHNSKRYADFAAFARVVDPILAGHGLHYRFRTEQDDRLIRVTCILGHKGGHQEETTLAGPADMTGNKNAIQAIGSTLTYLQRYSLKQALGLAAADDDDGKAAGDGGAINEDQIEALRARIVETGADLKKFLRYFKIENIDDLPATQFERAVAMLAQKERA
jgi:hypothetical protein